MERSVVPTRFRLRERGWEGFSLLSKDLQQSMLMYYKKELKEN
jgi:hypothetical protein